MLKKVQLPKDVVGCRGARAAARGSGIERGAKYPQKHLTPFLVFSQSLGIWRLILLDLR